MDDAQGLATVETDDSSKEPLTFPLSFAEQRLWFLDKLEPGLSVYNVPEAIRLKGPLVVDALDRSVQEIVRRHEVLRTTFGEINGEAVQIVAPSLTVHLAIEDLSYRAMLEREEEAWRRVSDEANRPFDSAKGPLLRVYLFRLSNDEHVLLINMHHIVSEGGWSMGVFLRELNALYNAFVAGQPSPLEELAIQYGDYATWQREWLQGSVLEELLAYWKAKLQNAPHLLELPSDRPRPATQTSNGRRESRLLPARLKSALLRLSKDEGATLLMSVLAAFKALLFRYTRQPDLVIGVPVAGRNSPETHDLIGMFVNTLALRTDLSGDPTFRELLRRVRQVSSEAHAHDQIPFEVLVDALNPDRTLSYSPLFQVMFAYQNAPREPLELLNLQASAFDFEIRTSMFDLRLFCWERPDGIQTTLEYSTDLFDPPTIRRLLEHFQVLLEAAAANADQPISRLPLLTEQERRTVLVDWNATEASYPLDSGLSELIAERAKQRPRAVAVSYRDQSLTYKDLVERANQLAAHLRSLGVGPDVLVGVCLERSVDLVVALLAIINAGGAYLPLDTEYPIERISLLLGDSRTQILVADQAIREKLPDYSGRIVSLDWNLSSQNSTQGLAGAPNPQRMAYVLYTSGSTGRPKGVSVSRGALLNLLWSMRSWFDLKPDDVFLGVTTISFDICGVDIWLPLLLGARLILADRATATDGEKLGRAIHGSGVTFLQATPVTWKLLLGAEWAGKPDLKAVCTGEAMPRELVRQLVPRVGRIWNMYGPTETTIWSTGYALTSPEDPPLIGRPIANTTAYIVDENILPVPIGVPGELYIGGQGLANGYLNREDLTAERFVPNPFVSKGGRLYRTGDVARYRPDGNIECLGRTDHQIKLRGFRIEPDEIRAALMDHPAVRDAVVVLDTGGSGERRLVAYFCARGEPPGSADLREFLQGKLPVYMVPSAFVTLDQLPLTPNGKVDRRALPAPDGVHAAERDFAEPRSPFEARLQKIWEDVLKVSPIGIRDNYFDLGGYSLLAVRLFSEIKKSFAIDLPLATLYHAPTIEALAAILEEDGDSAPWSSLVPIRREGSRPPFYCVSGIGGGVLVFRDLAVHLGQDQPVYALQPKRLEAGEVHPTSVAEIAGHFISEIQALQPRGPYFIGGYSFGGLVAFEMAQQLRQAGHEIGLLAMFDQNAPLRIARRNGGFLSERTVGSRKERLLEVLRSREGLQVVSRRIQEGTVALKQRLARRLNRTMPEELTTLVGSQGFAARNYVGHSYPGRIVVFRSMIRPDDDPWNYQLGWDKLAEGGVDVQDIPGDHLSIYSGTNISEFVNKLQSCLERAQSAG